MGLQKKRIHGAIANIPSPPLLHLDDQVFRACETSVVFLGTGAADKLVRFKSLRNRNSLVGKQWLHRVSTYTPSARLKFSNGRLGEARNAADITVGVAGCGGALTAFASEVDIPALLCRGDSEALWGQLDFTSDVLTIRNRGVGAPLKSNEMGHWVLSVASLG